MRRTTVVISACAMVVGALLAVLLVARDAGPATPRDVAEAFSAANKRHDWQAAWDLLCHDEQVARGPIDRYVLTQEAAVAMTGAMGPDLTITVVDVRPVDRSRPESYVADVVLARAGEIGRMKMLIVEEDGGYRACGHA